MQECQLPAMTQRLYSVEDKDQPKKREKVEFYIEPDA